MGKRLFAYQRTNADQYRLDLGSIVSIEEVVTMSGKSLWWVRSRIDRGEFESRKAGKTVLVSLRSVTDYCDEKGIPYKLDWKT